MPDSAIADFYASYFDSDALNGRPWQDGRQSHEGFVRDVEAALEGTGKWSTTGEYRMGGDVNVVIELFKVSDKAVAEGHPVTPNTKAYRVTAEHGIAMSAEYLSLETALGTLVVFIHLVWGLVSETQAWRELVFHHQ